MNNVRSYSVYLHEFPNGKTYVGITSADPLERWGANGCRYKSQPIIYDAIRKYGWENIRHTIVDSGLKKEDAETVEKELITKLRSADRFYGYNIEHGGNKGKVVSDETRRIIGESNRSRGDAWREKLSLRAKNRSPETIEKIRKAATGVHPSEETRAKMSASHKGYKHSAETVERMKIAQNNRSSEWEERRVAAIPKKPVLQIGLDGSLIKEWGSAAEASKETGIDFSKISACCRGKRKTTGGYRWSFSSMEGA